MMKQTMIAALIAMFALGSMQAFGQGLNSGQQQKQRQKRQGNVCTKDFQKHCGDHRGNRDKMLKCIRANIDKFSQACQQRLRGPRPGGQQRN